MDATIHPIPMTFGGIPLPDGLMAEMVTCSRPGCNDLFGLAKNARTSVLMLEKFYLTHLSPQVPKFTRQLRTKRVLETE
ncbi:MAG: hypothetical protein CL566_00860 [Alphaproteobacteria bacterium]|nr:hypothetical protein [Alphaproteobacteria bacterium]